MHALSDAYAEVDRTYAVSRTTYNRRLAAKQQLAALEAVYEDADQSEKTRLLDMLLDAQRRLTDAEIRYYRARVEYAFAIKEVHRQKGSLLDYNEIYLAEGPWPGKAYHDACRRDSRRSPPKCLADYRMARAPIVSQGPYMQDAPCPATPSEMPQPEPELPAVRWEPTDSPNAAAGTSASTTVPSRDNCSPGNEVTTSAHAVPSAATRGTVRAASFAMGVGSHLPDGPRRLPHTQESKTGLRQVDRGSTFAPTGQ
jgi:hypothetical protein